MKYLFIQNLIAPYRTSMFNALYSKGLDFEVLYMCELEKNRTAWSVNYNNLHYPFRLLQGIYKVIFGFHFHWDPQIIKYVKNHSDASAIIGGSWNCPDVIVICILKRLGLITNDLFFWTEANYLTTGARKKSRTKAKIRQFVLNSGDGCFIIPGKMSFDTLRKWNINIRKTIYLPNVIEEEKFKNFQSQKQGNTIPVFVIPARLEENGKGQLNFFHAIGINNIKKAKFLLLGNGSSYKELYDYVISNRLENNISILGGQPMNEVVRYYSISDVFLLPSFSDPSPLSVVEALRCNLPLLISTHCGNHFEALKENENGFSFSPFSKEEIRNAFEKMLITRDAWGEMGKISRMIFEEKFKQEVVLDNFIKEMTV